MAFVNTHIIKLSTNNIQTNERNKRETLKALTTIYQTALRSICYYVYRNEMENTNRILTIVVYQFCGTCASAHSNLICVAHCVYSHHTDYTSGHKQRGSHTPTKSLEPRHNNTNTPRIQFRSFQVHKSIDIRALFCYYNVLHYPNMFSFVVVGS